MFDLDLIYCPICNQDTAQNDEGSCLVCSSDLETQCKAISEYNDKM